MAPQSRSLFGGDANEALPCVLPHHLLMIAAASVSKQNDLYNLPNISSNTKVTKLEAITQATKIETELTKELDVVDRVPEVPEDLVASLVDDSDEEEQDEDEEWKEERLIKEIECTVKRGANGLSLKLLLKLEDDMNRQLCRPISEDNSGLDLAAELVEFGLISELDCNKVASIIQKCMNSPA